MVERGGQQTRSAIPIGLILVASLSGQPTEARPTFEVASVKPGGDIISTQPERSGGRISWTTELCRLIGYAYRLEPSRLTGRSCGAVFSVEATFNPGATDDQVRSMTQSLLADRFKLRAHQVAKQVNGYALVIGKNGPKIRKVNPAEEPPRMPEWVKDNSPAMRAESYIAATYPGAGVTAITGRRVTMSQLAATLELETKVPVWDQTGLAGQFYFGFRYRQDLTGDSQTDAPSLTTALQENLGLKLEKKKGSVEMLMIDSIQNPGDN
jgi:uncharacterized protein (TIGR03435 family)